jgi:hypothetical protein
VDVCKADSCDRCKRCEWDQLSAHCCCNAAPQEQDPSSGTRPSAQLFADATHSIVECSDTNLITQRISAAAAAIGDIAESIRNLGAGDFRQEA